MTSSKLVNLLTELHALSPMPSDEELAAMSGSHGSMLDRYVEITEQIAEEVSLNHPLDVITPLLASFGIGEGFGAYWSVLHCIESFPQTDRVYTLIQQASSSTNPGTRKWSCLLMGRRRDENDVPFLLERLKDAIPVVRCYALMGIEMIAQSHVLPSVIPAVSKSLRDEDKDVRIAAEEALAVLQDNG
jgi:hypothetical protein